MPSNDEIKLFVRRLNNENLPNSKPNNDVFILFLYFSLTCESLVCFIIKELYNIA